MSRIDELIAEHCPDGVEHKRLGDVLRIKNGKDHKSLSDGEVPVYGSGGIMRYVDTASASGPSVLIPRKGSLGNIFYVEGPFWVVDTIFRTEIDLSQVEPKFIYYQLLTMKLDEMNQAGGVPSQTQTVLNSLRLPVPPLEVQRAIVEVLDTFSKLEAELEAELEARKQQYEHYRAKLVGLSQIGEKLSLGEIEDRGIVKLGRGKVISKVALSVSPGDYPVYSSSGAGTGEFGRYGEYMFDDERITWSVDGGGRFFYRHPHRFSVTNVSGWMTVDTSVFRVKYLYYVLTTQWEKQSFDYTRKAHPSVIRDVYSIAVPSLSHQDSVVQSLDSLDALVNDLSVGLPAELAARRQQYEHYRDKLLTFKELEVTA
ncbi:restriction endonuclease subunit S [Leucobacter sp. Z1108]|uniref:restriction endonuclease subunit S n=1 Tax=Leucobacter sp. Z1108 TaxID=3439066 RepID=UPI003F3D7D99